MWKEYGAGRELGAGVIDVKGFYPDSPEDVAKRIRRVLAVCPAEKLCVNPDCGFGWSPRYMCNQKVTALAAGAALARAELTGRRAWGDLSARRALDLLVQGGDSEQDHAEDEERDHPIHRAHRGQIHQEDLDHGEPEEGERAIADHRDPAHEAPGERGGGVERPQERQAHLGAPLDTRHHSAKSRARRATSASSFW